MPPLTDILLVALVVLIAWGIWVFIIRTAGRTQEELEKPRAIISQDGNFMVSAEKPKYPTGRLDILIVKTKETQPPPPESKNFLTRL